MMHRIRLGLVSAIVGIFGTVALPAATKMKVTAIWPAAEIEYKEVVPGVKRAVLWGGNPEKESFGGLVKFSAGTKFPVHVHSSDAKLVVISGTMLYSADGKENKLGPGSYLVIPAGKKHISGAVDGELFFAEEWSGKFDMQMIDEQKPMTMEMSKTKEVIWPADQITYKEAAPGIKQAVLSGDPGKGEYAAITKFAPGFKAGLHYHTGDIKAVVIGGKMTIGDVNGVKSTAETGSFGLMPGGMIHSTEVDAKEGGIMYEMTSGKATTIMVGEKTEPKK